MAKGNFGEWVDKELYPEMYRHLDKVFPSMNFVEKTLSDKWISPKNIDGTDPKHRKKDKTFVLKYSFHLMQENGEGETTDLISKFMDFNNIVSRKEAIKEIAKILNLEVPKGSSKDWEEKQKKLEAFALSYDRQKRALFSPEGAHVLKYLREKRGYTNDQLIRDMGLGYISPSEAKYLNDNFQAGFTWNVEQYPLSMAHFSDGDIIGFNCRCISKDIAEKWGKYKKTENLNSSINENPFGIVPNTLNKNLDKKWEVVIVEGELDALHAIALGLPNVVAASTGNISREKVITLRKYGYRNIVILLDADGAGEEGTKKSILTISDEGLNAFVATIPDGKDADEYLQRHSIDELKELVDNANFAELWLYFKEREKFEQTQKTDIDKSNFVRNYIKIASRQKDKTKRERLYYYLSRDFQDIDITSIEKGIREEVESNISEEESEGSVKQALKDLRAASTTISEGNTLEGTDTLQDALRTIKRDGQKENALQVIKKETEYLSSGAEIDWKKKKESIAELKGAVKDLKESEQEETFASLLNDNTDELWKSYEVNESALKTKISFYNKGINDYFDLAFPSGAISIIGAQTNHGKSKFLQSIALDTIESMERGETLLYITYEESERSVNAQFLNSYFNDTLTRKGMRGSNIKTILEYLTERKEDHMRGETKDKFFQKEKEWKAIRREGKIKIIRPEDNYLQSLTSLILYATKKMKIKAIFIDYVQEIYVEDWAKYSRTDELKQAMVELDAIAQRTNLPVIMAAQLSREVVSPLDLYNQYIADSSWIEKKASEIILIWSNRFDCQDKSLKDKATKQDRIKREIPELRIGDNESGQLFLKITKSRIIPIGSYAVVGIDPNTGRVKGNLEEAKEASDRINKPQAHKQESPSSVNIRDLQKADSHVEPNPDDQYPYGRNKDRDTEEEEEETHKNPLQDDNEVKASEAPDSPFPTTENSDDLPF
jgi:DNA primase